jgi:hypothetical protein
VVTHPERSPMTRHTPESAARQITGTTSKPPFLYEPGPDGARKVLDDIQAAPIAKPCAGETRTTVPTQAGDVPRRSTRGGVRP